MKLYLREENKKQRIVLSSFMVLTYTLNSLKKIRENCLTFFIRFELSLIQKKCLLKNLKTDYYFGM